MAARLSLSRFARDERGATAIEYGLIAALIFLVVIVGFTSYANNTGGMYDRINEAITG